MSNIPRWLASLVTARPYATILVLALITILLAAGVPLRAQPLKAAATLPEEIPLAQALADLEELFGDSGEMSAATLLFRGQALTPVGLSQMDELLGDIASDPITGDLLAPANPVLAPTVVVKEALQVDSLESLTQDEIDSLTGLPGIRDALESMTGRDSDGTPVAIASIRLRDTGDQRIQDAERRIHELATGDQGPLRVGSISTTVIDDEATRATNQGMETLIGLSLLLIAALILLFMRTLSDLALTVAGLLLSMLWISGAEGWLGPNGLGLTGPPTTLTAMVPIIVISLTVDYAIQIVSHYREQRLAGQGVTQAVRTATGNVAVPLSLAAGTTAVSLLAGLFSPIDIVGDFGIIAGLGVALSLAVMLTLVPAGRTIIDRRREARRTLTAPRPISDALPGVRQVAELLGRSVTRRPAPHLIAVAAVTAGLGFAATNLESEFSIRDILPRGGSLLQDMNTLDAAFGGSTELASVLVKAEATDTRTILNLRDLTSAFGDPATRPRAAAGPIQTSYDSLLHDWTHDSGEPGDRYDPALSALFREASAGVQLDGGLMQELLDRLEAKDPEFARVLVNNPEGIDAVLLQFPVYSGNPEETRALQQDIQALWHGGEGNITAASESIILVAVTDSVTDSQTQAISTTIAVAFTVLAAFFWVSARRPALAVIAVGPIVLVLISVLGTMALLGIPYTIITSIITALSIGIGVDYTIHMIHRYREEYTLARDPERAAIQTLSTTGSALLGSALTTALGLGVLAASPLVASQQFGITATITIAYSLLYSILVVPPAMTVWGAYQNMRLRSAVRRWAEELDEVIEALQPRDEQEQERS